MYDMFIHPFSLWFQRRFTGTLVRQSPCTSRFWVSIRWHYFRQPSLVYSVFSSRRQMTSRCVFSSPCLTLSGPRCSLRHGREHQLHWPIAGELSGLINLNRYQRALHQHRPWYFIWKYIHTEIHCSGSLALISVFNSDYHKFGPFEIQQSFHSK